MKKIQDDIKKNAFESIYLLMGEEDYLRKQICKKMKEALGMDEQSMNYSYFTGKADEKEVMSMSQTLPFLSEKRLIIMEECDLFKKPSDTFVDNLKELPETTIIVFVEKEVDKRGRLYKLCKKEGYIADLGIQSEATLAKFVERQVAKEGKTISKEAITFFLRRVDNHMSMVLMELEKVIMYAYKETEITKEHVEAVTVVAIEDKIFDMIDAATRSEVKKTFTLYYDLLTLKEAPIKILVLLTRQFNLLIQIKDGLRLKKSNGEIAKLAGIAPFVVNKNATLAKQLSYKKLMHLFEYSVELDEKIKTGLVKDTMAVELLLTRCLEK